MFHLDRMVASWTMAGLLAASPLLVVGCTQPNSSAEVSPMGEVVTLYVGPAQVDCVGVGPRKCLQVRYSLADDYQLFYDDIAGFEYEPGYTYELLVEKTPVENPPADASSVRWSLVEVVAKTAVK